MTPDEELAALRKLAEDEWRFEPFGIRLSGGPHNGKELRVKNRPEVWAMPKPMDRMKAFLSYDDTYPTAASVTPVAMYRNTGHIDDDGWCVYEYEGIA